MRRMATATTLAAAQLLCGLGCGVTPSAHVVDAKSEFALCAEVLEMLENGPFVIKVTLANRRPRPVKIYWDNCLPHAYYYPPDDWKPQKLHTYPSCDVNPWGVKELAPGDQCSELLRIHESYSKIPAGRSTVRVTWPVYAPPERKVAVGDVPDLKMLAEPSAVLDVDVPAATPERLDALRRHIDRELRRPDLESNDKIACASIVLDTRHHALAPVAWQLIETQQWPGATSYLIRFAAECPEVYPDLDARLAILAADPAWDGTFSTFTYWDRWNINLPPTAWKSLTEADSVWTRALTYVVFPKRCGGEWKAALLQDLRDQSKPLPSIQLDRLLTDLDDEDFDVREKTSALLVRFGERVEGQLSKSLDRPLSAEVRQRVTAALERIRKAKQPPDCVQALEYFEAH